MTIREYILSLKDGERMIETTMSCLYGQTTMSCLYGRCGTVYHNKDGYPCIMWDKIHGEEGHMETSVTGGARRITEILNKIDVIITD